MRAIRFSIWSWGGVNATANACCDSVVDFVGAMSAVERVQSNGIWNFTRRAEINPLTKLENKSIDIASDWSNSTIDHK